MRPRLVRVSRTLALSARTFGSRPSSVWHVPSLAQETTDRIIDNPWHKRVTEGLESSLKSLQVEYLDLYLMHWPSSTDPNDLKKHYPDWNFIDTWSVSAFAHI